MRGVYAVLVAVLYDDVVVDIKAPARRPSREMVLQRMTVELGIFRSDGCKSGFKPAVVVAQRPYQLT